MIHHTKRGLSAWVPAAPLIALLILLPRPSLAASSATVDVLSLSYTRPSTVHTDTSTPAGTQIKILLTNTDGAWRALDLEASTLTAFADNKGTNLASPGDASPGYQPSSSAVSPDARSAVLTVWGAGLPAAGAEEIHVAGEAHVFRGGNDPHIAERADLRLKGGETFNVQPFRVVTSREGDVFRVELRCLKGDALVQDASMTSAGLVLAPVKKDLASLGTEWRWRGDFTAPPRADLATLLVQYLPIEKSEAVPFDVTVGATLAPPPSNPLVRWLKRFL